MSLCSGAEGKLTGLKAGINKSNADGKCVRLVIYSTNYSVIGFHWRSESQTNKANLWSFKLYRVHCNALNLSHVFKFSGMSILKDRIQVKRERKGTFAVVPLCSP